MTTPTPEAIQAAARAMHSRRMVPGSSELAWITLDDVARTYWTNEARAALSAAYPLMEAQAKGEALREAAGEIGRYIDAGADGDASPQDTIKWLRARATTIEGKSE